MKTKMIVLRGNHLRHRKLTKKEAGKTYFLTIKHPLFITLRDVGKTLTEVYDQSR